MHMVTTNHVTTTYGTLQDMTMYIYMYLEKVRTTLKNVLAEMYIFKVCYMISYKFVQSKSYTTK